jgi:hypothetical protein
MVRRAWLPPSAGALPAGILTAPRGLWPDHAPAWPAPHVSSVRFTGVESTVWAVRAAMTTSGIVESPTYPEVSRFWWRMETGFPALSFRQWIVQENWHVAVPAGHTPQPNTDDGLPILGFRWPWRPVWPGFVLNTGLYTACAALVWWPLSAASRWVKRRVLRKLRGLCPECAYSRDGLATDARCPECGAPG